MFHYLLVCIVHANNQVIKGSFGVSSTPTPNFGSCTINLFHRFFSITETYFITDIGRRMFLFIVRLVCLLN